MEWMGISLAAHPIALRVRRPPSSEGPRVHPRSRVFVDNDGSTARHYRDRAEAFRARSIAEARRLNHPKGNSHDLAFRRREGRRRLPVAALARGAVLQA